MLIFVRGFNTFPLYINPNDTIESIKSKIHVKYENLSPKLQSLVYGGRLLDDDDKTISDYNIQEETTIHPSLRLLSCKCCANNCSHHHLH